MNLKTTEVSKEGIELSNALCKSKSATCNVSIILIDGEISYCCNTCITKWCKIKKKKIELNLSMHIRSTSMT